MNVRELIAVLSLMPPGHRVAVRGKTIEGETYYHIDVVATPARLDYIGPDPLGTIGTHGIEHGDANAVVIEPR